MLLSPHICTKLQQIFVLNFVGELSSDELRRLVITLYWT